MIFEVAARSIVGERNYQEDAFRVFTLLGGDVAPAVSAQGSSGAYDGVLVLVADGMGGEGGGEVSSRTVADTFAKEFFAHDGGLDRRLADSLDRANEMLREKKRVDPGIPTNAGTTLVVGVLTGDHLAFLSVGDSLVYRFRDEEIHKVNADHESASTLDFQALRENSIEAWDRARTSQYRRHIMSAVMGHDIHLRQVADRRVLPGDVLVFASDGLETLSLENLRVFVPHLMKQPGGVAAVADGLVGAIERIKERSQDNTTMVVVHCRESGTTTIGADGASARVGVQEPTRIGVQEPTRLSR
jgi:serine/threonine protein phosphatase PrpC